MSSRPNLADRLKAAAELGAPKAQNLQGQTARSPVVDVADQQSPPSRAGKVMVAGYFSVELSRAVKVLAAERGSTVQALIGEGLDQVLRNAGRHPFGER